ncbi:MAG: D-alanine--D-alanine ligase [Planctomycetota bacterium]
MKSGRKTRVAILCGGKSAEHEISIQSAENILAAIDKDKYQPVPIRIDKKGRWYYHPDGDFSGRLDCDGVGVHKNGQDIAFVPGKKGHLFHTITGKNIDPVDIVFPVLHGPFGEDGTVQGMLELADVPFVGTGVLGSSIAMDKDIAKRLLRQAGLDVADFAVFHRSQGHEISYQPLKERLGTPLFVKPANLGSSVGISKVRDEDEFASAVKKAFEFDRKILVEKAITGREIECAVLGNEDPQASVPGEIIPNDEFYSYRAKYLDQNGACLQIPADISEKEVSDIQACALGAFKTLCCEGMARVDFFLMRSGKVVVNEVNTIPGFTKISMFPKLWQAAGISYSALIDKLIDLAVQRYQQKHELKTEQPTCR